VIPVQTEKERQAFIHLPWRLYNRKDHPQWVPPLKLAMQDILDTKKHPFYKKASIQLFLAMGRQETQRKQQVVGRIAAIENQAHNRFYQDKVGFYGFFECMDEPEVARALFHAAESWLKERGLTHMRGPMNPSTNHECGLLVRGQSQHPTIMTSWNPKYYVSLHEQAGLVGVKDLVAYFLHRDFIHQLPPKVLHHANEVRQKSPFVFRDFDMRHFERDAQICYDIYNVAWEKNWGFFPMSREEFFYMAKEFRPILDPRFAFIAEKHGKPAGFMIALPDINHILKRIRNGRLFPTGILKLLLGRYFLKTVRIVALGILPEYRREGIFSLFTYEAFLRGVKHKMVAGEASWILEDNEGMNKPWKELGAPLYKRWRIYERPIRPS
jgi:GNAT superfamily N-acetyltransferase